MSSDLTYLVANALTRNDFKTVQTTIEKDASSASSLEIQDESNDSPWDISDSDEDVQSSQDGKSLPSDQKVKLSNFASKVEGHPLSIENHSLELPLLLHSIRHTVSCLYRMPIRRPAPILRLKKSATVWSLYQHFDVLHVQDKFPQVSSDVARRLGKSNSRRRQLLQYRESHYEALSTNPLDEASITTSLSLDTNTEVPESKIDESAPGQRGRNDDVKSLVSSRHETVHTKATTLRIDNTSGDVLHGQYAPSMADSRSSKASTFTGKLKVEVPRRPRDADGKEMEEFECPFCFTIQCVSNQHQWK